MADGSNFARLNAASPNTWSEERTERARHLWVERGWSATQVAKDLGGLTRSAVIGKASRMGWKRDAAAVLPPAFVWNDALDARLREAVAAGDTDARIAMDLGAPIRSVSHRRDRLGLAKRPIRRKPTLVFNRHPNADATHGVERTPTPPTPEPAHGSRTLLTVDFWNECKWPMSGSGFEMTVCGCKSIPDRPYCAAHEAKSRSPIQPKAKTKDLERSLRRYA